MLCCVDWDIAVNLEQNDSVFTLSEKQYNNIYLLQLGCYPVAVVILHVNKTWNLLLLNLSREDYMKSM